MYLCVNSPSIYICRSGFHTSKAAHTSSNTLLAALHNSSSATNSPATSPSTGKPHHHSLASVAGETIEDRLLFTNRLLREHNFPTLPTPSLVNLDEVGAYRTLDCVASLLAQRQSDAQFRESALEKTRRLESDLESLKINLKRRVEELETALRDAERFKARLELRYLLLID